MVNNKAGQESKSFLRVVQAFYFPKLDTRALSVKSPS